MAFFKKPREPKEKKRKRMPQESAKRKAERRIYEIDRDVFLALNPWCKMNVLHDVPKRASQVHHKRGRGKWYLDMRYWIPSCAACHEWENSHRNQAVALGLRERVR